MSSAAPPAVGTPAVASGGRRADVAFTLAALVYAALIWWPTRELPYHWDSATFVARAARDLLARDFQPFVAQFSFFAHPPLFIAGLALWQKSFGTSLLAAHVFVAPFLPLLLLSTYALGARLYARAVGAAAAALVGTAAVVVAEQGQIYFDLPLAALSSLATFLWLTQRSLPAVLVLSLCAGIKIPSIIVPCALLAAELLRRDEKPLWRRAAPLCAPFVVIAAWLVYHHAIEGFWLRRPPLRSHMAMTPLALLEHARAVVFYLYTQGRWVAGALGVGGLLTLLARRRASFAALRAQHGTLVLTLIALGGVAFFALAGEFAERYGIVLMPALSLLSMAALHAALQGMPHAARVGRALPFAALAALACALQLRAWYPEPAASAPAALRLELRPDADLRYLDVIALGRTTADYLQREHPGARVYGSWPETYWLGEPYLGYTARAFPVADCRDYRADASGEKVIFGHLYAPEQRACWKLIAELHARPIQKLQVGQKWVQLHLVP